MANQYKSLSYLLRDKDLSYTDTLHLVAIANLKDDERILQRWWCKKYKKPLKDFENHIQEELVIEMLEDYYEANPVEIEKFLFSYDARSQGEWDGKVSEEHEKKMQKRFKNDSLIAKYQSQEDLSPEEEAAILDSLGKNLPKSKMTNKEGVETIGSGEFDETF